MQSKVWAQNAGSREHTVILLNQNVSIKCNNMNMTLPIWTPDNPFNDLPRLPPELDLESSPVAKIGGAAVVAALRALATEGIQQGHMTLHARSVVTAAGAPPEIFETVTERLVESGEIKIWKAEELISEVRAGMGHSIARAEREEMAAGHGKIILFGEHAVVYGTRAIAAPVPYSVRARIIDGNDGVWLVVPRWGVEQRLRTDPGKQMSFEIPAALILRELGLADRSMRIEVFSEIPRAMGLGGSAEPHG
mgnify:CR=1 FL=1